MEAHVVPDTSVVIKWFRQGENLAKQALALRTAYLDGRVELSVPTLLGYELANVLRFKEDLSTDQVKEALQSLFDMRLAWVPISTEMLCRAIVIGRESGTTVYDATFAALAEGLHATFVTADDRLVQRLHAWPFVRFLGDAGPAGEA